MRISKRNVNMNIETERNGYLNIEYRNGTSEYRNGTDVNLNIETERESEYRNGTDLNIETERI